jgi:hypothetical protein
MFVWAKYTVVAPVFTCFSSIRFQGSKALGSAFCVQGSGFRPADYTNHQKIALSLIFDLSFSGLSLSKAAESRAALRSGFQLTSVICFLSSVI